MQISLVVFLFLIQPAILLCEVSKDKRRDEVGAFASTVLDNFCSLTGTEYCLLHCEQGVCFLTTVGMNSLTELNRRLDFYPFYKKLSRRSGMEYIFVVSYNFLVTEILTSFNT